MTDHSIIHSSLHLFYWYLSLHLSVTWYFYIRKIWFILDQEQVSWYILYIKNFIEHIDIGIGCLDSIDIYLIFYISLWSWLVLKLVAQYLRSSRSSWDVLRKLGKAAPLGLSVSKIDPELIAQQHSCVKDSRTVE